MARFDPSSYTGDTKAIEATQSGNGATVPGAGSGTVACFLRGTRILTADGEVPVEDLSEGDIIVTVSGATRPVKWIGKRGYVTRLVSPHQRENILPIRFVRGSLAEGLPKRDLFVSSEHMMFLDGMLIPARHLVNGTSIAYFDASPIIEYFHVELQSHDVILAEGAAAESWLDTGKRNMFANVLEYQPRHEDNAPGTPYAPVVTEGPRLIAVRSGLEARSTATGFDLTTDPDLHLLADDTVVRGGDVSGTVYRFELAKSPVKLAIASLVSVPSDIDAGSTDGRSLGVCVKSITLKGAHALVRIAHDEPSLAEGYHAAEPGHRWTAGNATIPAQFLACLSGPLTVEVELAALNLRYARQRTGLRS
jgi:Hint domain